MGSLILAPLLWSKLHAVAVGVATFRLLLCSGGAAPEGEWAGGCLSLWGAAKLCCRPGGWGTWSSWGFPAAGLYAGMPPSSCEAPVPLRPSKSTRFSFVPGAPAVGTRSQVLLFSFPSIQHTTHCVSMLWCGWLGLGI